MAYMNQERKAALAPAIKAACQKHGVKATLAVHNYSTLVLNIKSGKIDFIGNYNRVAGERYANRSPEFCPAQKDLSVNPYWYKEQFDGDALAFLSEVLPLMNIGNHNRSDSQTDYFDVGWYVDVNVGRWNKPYDLIGDAK